MMSEISTLPQSCPRDGSPCRRGDCELYVVDWRSNNEYCMLPTPIRRDVKEVPSVPDRSTEARPPIDKNVEQRFEQVKKNLAFIQEVPDDYEGWFWEK